MLQNLLNLNPLSNASKIQAVPLKEQNPQIQSKNSFLSYDSSVYGKNLANKNGYYAGEYNNKANIVGQRLFVLA